MVASMPCPGSVLPGPPVLLGSPCALEALGCCLGTSCLSWAQSSLSRRRRSKRLSPSALSASVVLSSWLGGPHGLATRKLESFSYCTLPNWSLVPVRLLGGLPRVRGGRLGPLPPLACPNLLSLNRGASTTLCGGSLGSRVDEERSQLRELM